MDKQKIEKVIKNFNFENVHRAMKLLKWEWAHVGIPGVPELEKTARGLLEQLDNSESNTMMRVSSGGFVATRTSNLKYTELSLEFVLESFHCEYRFKNRIAPVTKASNGQLPV